MVLGRVKERPVLVRDRVDLIAHKLARVEFEEGNKHLPRVFVADSVIKNLSNPWREALVIKVLGKNLGYTLMRKKLQGLWKPKGGFETMDIDHGVFMVKFDQTDDKENVLKGGPWMVFDRCLAVSLWSPDLVTSESLVLKTLVWIRFPGLNPAYYDESLLFALATSVGKPLKVDAHTTQMNRGRYARVCMEIDLSQPVAKRIWFRNQWIRVEYEGIHIICDHCGCYGHLSRNCITQNQSATSQQGVHAGKAASQKGVHAGKAAVSAGHANPSSKVTQGAHKSQDNDGWTQIKDHKSRANLNSNSNAPSRQKQKPPATSKAKLKSLAST
ncbi:uncharacterized protein LOC130712391 [Lotus japonicus]|uniref:uncharacterized protein LOC130712391 n=1 Tax=Lotus japonicus TaxID=34305 RepID=UPI00258F98D0|nr:uncharacterized protein LOC130712391 [Lotus japonicus]